MAPQRIDERFDDIAPVRDTVALLQCRSRHPSSARHKPPTGGRTCPACGWAPLTFSDAPDAVRRLLALASHLLVEGASTAHWARVARLRDELHVTANRVERFNVDEHPIIDSVGIAVPAAAGVVLEPEQLLFQLDLAVGRLAALLEPLSEDDWRRRGRSGSAFVTLGELLETVLHQGIHDLVDATSRGKAQDVVAS